VEHHDRPDVDDSQSFRRCPRGQQVVTGLRLCDIDANGRGFSRTGSMPGGVPKTLNA
jgi:hypothetical protein